jgi:thioredoxin reductase
MQRRNAPPQQVTINNSNGYQRQQAFIGGMSMSNVIATNQTILVVGGGISGVTAAIEAAECGKQIILIEKNLSLGGRVSQLYKYSPKLGFPSCGMEINLRRMKANRNLNILTMTEVSAVSAKRPWTPSSIVNTTTA